MNEAIERIIAANDADRRDVFLAASARLGTAVQNVEKDFWVCWTLDALFNGLEPGGPRLLFKGGTSLSKSFGLISRFSEDIDITVFRDDLGTHAEVDDLESLSRKQRDARLNAIREACQAFVNGAMLDQLTSRAASILDVRRFRIEPDAADPDQQSLLFWYPVATARENEYVRSAVKIEAGAKSALDPHEIARVVPYIADDLPDLDLAVPNVVTVGASRTFWDKIVIVHGLRQWYERRGALPGDGQRVSRHYYDLYRLMQHPDIGAWLADDALAESVTRHANTFFHRADRGLESAYRGGFTLSPLSDMRGVLQRDYAAMIAMIFGTAPSFTAVMAAIEDLERRVNAAKSS